MAERIHHPLSFSKWSALKVCPFFTSSPKSSDAAKRGSDSHDKLSEHLELANVQDLEYIDDNSDRGANFCANFILKKRKELVEKGGVLNGIHTEEKVEVKTGLSYPMEGTYGWCDAWFLVSYTDKPSRLCVFDYKSGASTNFDDMPQVMGYAFGIITTLRSLGVEVDEGEVDCYIVYGADFKTSYGCFNFEQLFKNAFDVNYNINHRDELARKCNGHCQYCGGNMLCEEIKNQITKLGEGNLADIPYASLYSLMSIVKSVADKKLDELKDVARANRNFLDDGEIRYELKADKHGKMTSININVLLDLMSAAGVAIDTTELLRACSLTKASFKSLVKDRAKAAGLKDAQLDDTYDSVCEFGKPSEKMVRVDVLR